VRWIGAHIGDIRLSELSISDVEGFMHAMTEEGYSPRSCTRAFRLLKQALKWAVACDIITKNPCDFCKPPKRNKAKVNALDRAERSRMLALARRAQPEPLGLAIELALTTGMRRGEVCALRWSDLGEGTITVSHAIGYGEGGIYLKEPKTESSRRTIPLTAYTRTILEAGRRDSERLAATMGVSFGDPFILGTQEPDSRPYNPAQLTKDFAAFCKMNGFSFRFHDLRHTFATMMIGSGCDVRTVASYLGHTSVSMTLDTYAEVDPDAKRAAVSKVEGCFDGGAPLPNFPSTTSGTEEHAGEIRFTVEQLEAMLATARAKEAGDESA
jgi:integrase